MRILLAILAGLVVVAAAAVAGLPALLAPKVPAPTPPPLDPGRLAAAVAPGSAGQDLVTLTADDLDALAAAALGGAASTAVRAAWVTLGEGSVHLYLTGRLPGHLPGLSGRPWGLDATLRPTVPASGRLELTLRELDLGRLPVTAVLPPDRILALLAARLPGPHPWWQVHGAALEVDLASAPPLEAGSVRVHLSPTAVAVHDGALVLTAAVAVDLLLPAPVLTQTLQEALVAAGGVPLVRLQPGAVAIALPPTGQYVLTPSVPEPGVVRLTNTGSGAVPELGLLLQKALGPDARALTWDASGLTLDLRRAGAVALGQGVRLRLWPTAITLDPAALRMTLQVLPPG